MAKVAVLMSGGVDSSTLLAYARRTQDAVGVWYDHGQASRAREARALPGHVVRRALPWSGEGVRHGSAQDAFYLPGRNALLLLAMICQHRPDAAWFGALVTEQRPNEVDKNAHFRELLTGLASYVMAAPVRVDAPLAERGLDKAAVIQWALDDKLLSEAELRATYSCYHDAPLPYVGCGSCRQCVRRYLVFNALGIREFADAYMVDPLRGEWSSDFARILEEDHDELWGHMPRSTLAWADWGLKLGAAGRLKVALERLLKEAA